jgi:hypothetical protein
MGVTGFPKTSAKSYHSALRKIPEERAEEFVDQQDDC